MKTLRARVENGKIIGDAPEALPEGTELELCLADPGDEMTDEELTALNDALAAAWRSIEAGRFRPASEVLEALRAPR